MEKVVVLVPCYNEELTIKKVVEDAKKYLKEASVYVYDNNSSDKSAEIAKSAGAIVRYEHKQGKGNVVRTMFREIDALCYVIVDADDTYDLQSVKDMVDLVIDKNYDMVIGDRLSSTYFTENKRRFHNFGNTFVRFFINKIFNSDIKDVMTGYRCFSYDFVKTFPILTTGFEIETEMTIHAIYHNFNIINKKVNYKDRIENSTSKLNTIPDGIKVIFTIIKLYRDYKPMEFFTILAFLLFVVATIFFVPIIITFKETGLVPKIPTLIVSMFIYLSSIILYFVGVILTYIATQNKKEFEHNYINISNVKKEKIK